MNETDGGYRKINRWPEAVVAIGSLEESYPGFEVSIEILANRVDIKVKAGIDLSHSKSLYYPFTTKDLDYHIKACKSEIDMELASIAGQKEN